MTPIKIEATDNSGQAVTNKVEGLPDGVTFDEATNTISGTPSEVGKYNHYYNDRQRWQYRYHNLDYQCHRYDNTRAANNQ